MGGGGAYMGVGGGVYVCRGGSSEPLPCLLHVP